VLRLVHDLAVRQGAEILYGNKVVRYESSDTKDKPVVILEGGARMVADCIINAAGLASLGSISTELESMSDWRPMGISLYTSVITISIRHTYMTLNSWSSHRTIIPGEKMEQDPELNELLQLQEVS
jgi:hypothetical protein